MKIAIPWPPWENGSIHSPLEQEIYEISLEYLMVPESEEMLKNKHPPLHADVQRDVKIRKCEIITPNIKYG